MTDIDFEDLDKAVNSAMGNNSGASNSTSPTSAPKVDASAPSRSKSDIAIKVPPRRSGRFMDVVHPSSNMQASRAAKPTTVADKSSVVSTTPTLASSRTNNSIPSFSMPDPIDEHEKRNASPSALSEKAKSTAGSTTEVDTPFLAGTKVEKRPLGAFSTVIPTDLTTTDLGVNENSSPKGEPSVEKPQEESFVGTIPGRDAHLPEELQAQVLAVEADPTTSYIASSPAGEIVRQYNEKPSNVGKAPSSIYDTKEYHAALLKKSKKKSGWMVPVWIGIIIAVCIAAAIFAYFNFVKK